MTPNSLTSPPPKGPFLSVIIPAYNEESRLPSTIRLVEDFLGAQSFSWELIVVDDGSKDGTVAAAEKAFADHRSRVVRNERNMGKGATVRHGMLAARGRYRLFTDADNSTPIEQVLPLLRRVTRGRCDVAIGSRALRGSRLEVRQPFYRETMGRVFNLVVQMFALPGLKDTQCGFKLFSAEAAEVVFRKQRLDGFSFDVEILYLARQAGFRVSEVPIRWIDSPASRVSPLKDSVRMFVDILRIRTGL